MKNRKIAILVAATAIALPIAFLSVGCSSSVLGTVTDNAGLKTYTLTPDGEHVPTADFFFDGSKDKMIDEIEFDPATGKFAMKGYTSTANAGAVAEAGAVERTNMIALNLLANVLGQRLNQAAAATPAGAVLTPPAPLPVDAPANLPDPPASSETNPPASTD